jgi:hypothetical protein
MEVIVSKVLRSRVSSVGVAGTRRTAGVRIPAAAGDFSLSHSVRTGSEALSLLSNFPFSWVPELSPASATSVCNSQLTACLQTPSRLTGDGSWASLYSLGTDRTENSASNSSCIVACVSVATITRRLQSHCLATGVFTEPFRGNGYFCWLHHSCFQQTCHNIV